MLGTALALAFSLWISSSALAQSKQDTEPPDLGRGEEIWAKCRVCHTYDRGGRHLVGPNLHGIFGKKAGTVERYVYSDAMRNSNIVWTEATLDRYLEATQDFIPGNKMYGGLAIEQDRIDLIAWLKKATGL
jgi:cytochrome c